MSISNLVKCGNLAIDYYQAMQDVKEAKCDFYYAWSMFEANEMGYDELPSFIPHENRIRTGHPLFEAACESTKGEYRSFKEARRIAYNLKRRLDNACRAAS